MHFDTSPTPASSPCRTVRFGVCIFTTAAYLQSSLTTRGAWAESALLLLTGKSKLIKAPNLEKQLKIGHVALTFELGHANKSLNLRRMQLRRGDLDHPQIVAVFLIFASIVGIANFAVYPVFSQSGPTTASISLSSNMTTGYNQTVTVVQTYKTTGFTTSSSLFTQIIVAFVTSTTFFTYVQITFTSSTSTLAYPAPPVRPRPNSGPLQMKPVSNSVLGTVTEYGGSSSMLVVLLIAASSLVKRKMSSEQLAKRS